MRRALLFCVLALPLAAQRGSVDARGSFGLASFLDDGSSLHHVLVGGSVRYYITRRLSIEPEVLYLGGTRSHYDVALVPNIVWDFGGRRVVPYVRGGVGLLRSKYFGPAFNNRWYSAGGGVKIYLNDRWFIAPEFGIAWEPSIRVSAGIGYSWRR